MDPMDCEHNTGNCHDDSLCEKCPHSLPLWHRPAEGTIGEVVMAYFKSMAGAKANGVVGLSELREAQDKIGFLENQVLDLANAYDNKKQAYEERIMGQSKLIASLERQADKLFASIANMGQGRDCDE